MKVEGGGLYLVEGVLATIEVKSFIDSRELSGALENCRSVLELSPRGEYPEEAEKRITYYMSKGNLSYADAEHRFWYMFRPATYIFSFTSRLSLGRTSDCIKEWWEKTGCPVSAYFPLLPRVIAAGNVVGFVNDGRINLHSESGSNHIFALFRTNRRFRWFCLHLMDAVSMRLGVRNFAEQFDYRTSNYYPIDEYICEIAAQPTKILTRNLPAAQ